MFRAAAPLSVSADQKRELELLVRNGNSPQKIALRCKVVLLAQEGVANASIAEQLKISRPTVLALRAAFAKDGMTAVTAVRRRKRSPKVLTPELEQRILDTTLKNASWRRQHTLERTHAGGLSASIENGRAPGLATSRRATASCRAL
jgi:DNA-binding CsgD family transcriptional regulator